MLAYHGDPKIKRKYLARVRRHRRADQIVKGKYWESSRGCAVGCTIHGQDHDRYETELGIPAGVAWLEDRIFENLPGRRALEWPEQFLAAIETGTDLSRVCRAFLHWLVADETIRRSGPELETSFVAELHRVADLNRRAAAGAAVMDQEWIDASNSFRGILHFWTAPSQAVWLGYHAASANDYYVVDAVWCCLKMNPTRRKRAASAVRMADRLIEILASASAAGARAGGDAGAGLR